MNEFEIVVVIGRPASDVFAALVDVDRAPDWNPGVTEVRRTSDGPIEVGSTVVYVGKFLGRNFESPSECTDYVAGKTFTSKSASGPFDLEVANSLESVDGGTKLTTVYRGESKRFFRLAEPVVVRLAKKQFETASENLKALLEADALP
jgi:uncharacterized protein YndB with AHSA1/START domain